MLKERKKVKASSGFRGVYFQRCRSKKGIVYDYWKAAFQKRGYHQFQLFPYTDQGKLEAARWVNMVSQSLCPELPIPNPSVETESDHA